MIFNKSNNLPKLLELNPYLELKSHTFKIKKSKYKKNAKKSTLFLKLKYPKRKAYINFTCDKNSKITKPLKIERAYTQFGQTTIGNWHSLKIEH